MKGDREGKGLLGDCVLSPQIVLQMRCCFLTLGGDCVVLVKLAAGVVRS